MAKFVDDAYEFAGFDIPGGCNIFPAVELDSEQIEELEKEKEHDEKPTPPMPVTYNAGSFSCNTSYHVQFVGDSSAVISWLNCQSAGIGMLATQTLDLRGMFVENWRRLNFDATAPSENIALGFPREHNKQADALATTCVLHGHRLVHMKPVRGCARFFRLSFDGCCREGIMGAGWAPASLAL